MDRTHTELRRFIIDNFLYGRDCKLRDDDSFQQAGIIDSTGLLELVTFLETRYKIHVDDSDLVAENLDSIQRLAQFLRRKLDQPNELAGLPELANQIM
jgi:acyl carrier protein